MRVTYLSCRLTPSGGTKIIAQHVNLLNERGHDAQILTLDGKQDQLWGTPVARVKAFNQDLLGGADILVATWLRDVETASKIKGPAVCHFCQGYEPTELSFRIRGEDIPTKYRFWGRLGRLLFLRKKWSFRRRIRAIERIYRLPTFKIAISYALKEIVENHYGGNCRYVPNGIDSHLFSPPSQPISFRMPLRLLSVGPNNVVIRGVEDTFRAVQIVKGKNIPVEFIRVSQSEFGESERRGGLVDRFLVGLDEREMADLYRNGHFLIAPSLWGAIGLPAVEAMSCGVPCILTATGKHRSLDPAMDFAYFVPPHSPEAIAEGIIKIRDDPALRNRIVRRGFEVARQYTLKNMGDRLEEALSGILEEWKRPKPPETGNADRWRANDR